MEKNKVRLNLTLHKVGCRTSLLVVISLFDFILLRLLFKFYLRCYRNPGSVCPDRIIWAYQSQAALVE